jgi:hypothetical protein
MSSPAVHQYAGVRSVRRVGPVEKLVKGIDTAWNVRVLSALERIGTGPKHGWCIGTSSIRPVVRMLISNRCG